MNSKRKTVARGRQQRDAIKAASKVIAGPPLSKSVSDTLYNLATGMGTEKDKSSQTLFGFSMMAKQQLEAAYRADWISRKVIDIPAYDATREWRSWEADPKDMTKIEGLEKKLNIRKKVMMGLQRARLYGGGALILGIDQGRPEDPVDVESLGADCLKWVHVVSRYEIAAGQIDWDLSSDYFGKPAYYERSLQAVTVTAATKEQVQTEAQMNAKVKSGGFIRLHPSRVVRLTGLETPEWTLADGWGDSVLQVCADAILAMGTVSQSMASLVQEAKVDIVKIPQLSEMISDKVYEDRLKNRFAMANTMKSLFSLLILDKEEEWQRVQQQFTGMPEVLQAYMLTVCGAADIPATRFMGQAPKGMSATGDSDTRNYYDKVSTEQETTVQPELSVLDDAIVISALGKKPDGIFYDWNPLWQMDEGQKADIATKQATVMAADVASGLLDPMVLQKARESQLIESGFYPGIEQIIEEYGTDINEREPAPGAAPQLIDPQTGQPPDPNDPEAQARAQAGQTAVPAAPAQPGAKTPANSNNQPPKKTATDNAIGDMAARIRDAITDASTPRTLYIYRPVLNWQDIKKHYAAQDVQNVFGSDQHVTVCYSKTPVDWLKVGADNWGSDDEGRLLVKAGGPRVMEKFGNYLVLAFSSSDLQYRHCSILDRTGGSWDYDDYTPHVSISRDPGAVDPMQIEPWTGPIILGPEEFEEIKPEYFPTPGQPDDSSRIPDSLVAVVDAIRNMPPPQVHVTVKNGRVLKEDLQIHHDAHGRAIAATKTTTEGRIIKEDIQIQHDEQGRAVAATKTVSEVLSDGEGNPNHGPDGKFISGGGEGSGADDAVRSYINTDPHSPTNGLIINEKLRSGEDLSEEQKNVVSGLTRAINNSPNLGRDTVFYRGAQSDVYKPRGKGNNYTAPDPGFVSLTSDKDVAEMYAGGGIEGSVVYEITVPKGSRILNTKRYGDPDEESEHILPRYAVFERIGKSTKSNGITHVKMRYAQ